MNDFNIRSISDLARQVFFRMALTTSTRSRTSYTYLKSSVLVENFVAAASTEVLSARNECKISGGILYCAILVAGGITIGQHASMNNEVTSNADFLFLTFKEIFCDLGRYQRNAHVLNATDLTSTIIGSLTRGLQAKESLWIPSTLVSCLSRHLMQSWAALAKTDGERDALKKAFKTSSTGDFSYNEKELQLCKCANTEFA